MAAVRVLVCLLLVAFFLQLVSAGVRRRDTAAESDAFAEVRQGIEGAITNLQTALQGLANSNNTSAFFDEFGNHLTHLQNRASELFQNVTQHLNQGQGAAA